MESGRIVRKIANFQSSRTFVSMIKSIIEVSKQRLPSIYCDPYTHVLSSDWNEKKLEARSRLRIKGRLDRNGARIFFSRARLADQRG